MDGSEAVAAAVAQFGMAGLVAWMWLTERRHAAERDKQVGQLHERILEERRGTEALVSVLERNTSAITALREGQRHLGAAVERLSVTASQTGRARRGERLVRVRRGAARGASDPEGAGVSGEQRPAGGAVDS